MLVDLKLQLGLTIVIQMANVAFTMLTKVRLQILSLQLQDQFKLPLQ